MIYLRSQKFLSRTSSSSSSLVCAVFRESPVYTFAGLNLVYGGRYKRVYMCDDKYCAESFVHFLMSGRNLNNISNGQSDIEQMLRTITTS